MESKHLIELVTQQSSEEGILDAARETARCTFELLDYLDNADEKGHDAAALQFLQGAAKEVRTAVLQLIKAARSLYSNPFDFLSKQTMDNCLGEVVRSIKTVIQYAESTQVAEEGDEEAEEEEAEVEFNVVEDTRVANMALQQLFTITKQAVPPEVLVQNAKAFLDSMNQLMLISRSLNLGVEEKLRDDSLLVINSAKLLAKEPGNPMHLRKFQDAMRQCQVVMKTFLFACSKYREGSKLEMRKSLEPLPADTAPAPPAASTNHLNTHANNNIHKDSPPALAPAPAPAAAHTPKPPHQNGTAVLAKRYSTRLPLDKASDGATSGDTKENQRPNSPPSRSVPSPQSQTRPIVGAICSIHSPRVLLDPSHQKLVNELSVILSAVIPSFAREWAALTDTVKDDTLNKIRDAFKQTVHLLSRPPLDPVPLSPAVSDVTSPLAKGSPLLKAGVTTNGLSGSSGDSQEEDDDAEAMMELQKIIKMKNSNDWGMMSLSSLKSLTRRLSKKQGSIGDVDALIGITIAEIPKKLREMCACISEATVDLLDNVNESLAAMQQGQPNSTNPMATLKRKSILAPKDAEKYLGHAVEQMFSVIKMTFGLTAKLRTDAEEATERTRKYTLPKPPQSPDEERQRAQKNLVGRMLNNAAKFTENAPRKGKHVDKIVSALNSTSHSNSNYVKLKLEESLDSKIYSDSTGLRALAAQLLSAINALLEEQASDAYNFTNVLQIEAAGRSLVTTVGRLLDSLETLKYIIAVTMEFTGKSAQSTSVVPIIEDDEKDTNVWDDEGEVLFSDSNNFKAGALNAVITRLTSDTNYDTKFLSTFITTYQSFMTPWKLLDKLLQRYKIPKGKIDEKRVTGIQLRVCVVLKYWIDNQCADFDKSLTEALRDFVTTQLPRDGHSELSKSLSNLLATKTEELSVKRKALTVNPYSSLQVQERHSPSALFCALNESEIARQLTLIEFNLFSQIQFSELFNQSWNKPRLHHRAPHVLNMISRSNHCSFWVASLLLWASTLKERVSILTKFIKIAQHLRELNNFNTLMGVIAGINMSAISRMKLTFGELDKSTRQILDQLQTLLNPSSSFKNYRQELHSATPPCLPYLGTYLTDLTFMEDGNPDYLPSKTGKPLINFAKRELIYNVIRELQLYQQNSYKFPVVEPIHTFLTALPFGEEKDLYELSLLREPRTADPPPSHK